MNEEKFLLRSAEDDIDEDEGMTRLEMAQMLANELGMTLVPSGTEAAGPLTGEALYGMYEAEYASQNCGVDSWANLEENDQEVWNAMARGLLTKP